MCGIGGILRVWTPQQREEALRTPHVRSIPEAWLDILDDAVKHRGPDGHGRFRDRAVRADGCVVDVAFVHRRLSIIDLADGHQPMLSLGRSEGVVKAKRLVLGEGIGLYERDAASELVGEGTGRARRASEGPADDRVCVIFNGCIYNHRELRAELQRAGHAFSTDHSDTEVLVHGWRKWEHGLWGKLDGMYAVALWDHQAARLACARDTFGEKPLYSLGCVELSALASSVPGLLRIRERMVASGASVKLSSDLTQGWIEFGWNQAGPYNADCFQSHYPGSAQMLGEPKKIDAGAWNAPDHLNTPHNDIKPEAVDAAMRESVRARLEADVPLATFLSGGTDSALIACYAKEFRPDIEAFTVRMPEGAYDESSAASVSARVLDVRHRVLDCRASPCEDLQGLVQQLGLPFGDSSLLPTHWVSQAARQHCRVALAGDGGDEMFLGYERHTAMRWLAWLEMAPRGLLGTAASLIPRNTSPKSRVAKLSRLLAAARFGSYKDLVAIFPPPTDREIGLASEVVRHYGMTTRPSEVRGEGLKSIEFARRTWLRFDRAFYLPDDLLRKTDTASMAVALEVRSPFLARSVTELAIGGEPGSLMPHNQRKGLLRQVARRYLPAEIVDRPKMGFAIPIGEWFRSDYGGLRSMLLDHLNSAEPFGPPGLGIDLNMRFVRQMLDEHLGTGPSGLVKRDHSQRLYMLLVLSIWAKWLGGLGGGHRPQATSHSAMP